MSSGRQSGRVYPLRLLAWVRWRRGAACVVSWAEVFWLRGAYGNACCSLQGAPRAPSPETKGTPNTCMQTPNHGKKLLQHISIISMLSLLRHACLTSSPPLARCLVSDPSDSHACSLNYAQPTKKLANFVTILRTGRLAPYASPAHSSVTMQVFASTAVVRKLHESMVFNF